MKNILIGLSLALFLSGTAPALAQYQPPSTKLTPYEETRYGDSLWQVPREPYQSRYRAEQEASKLMKPPAAPRAGRSSGRPGSGLVDTAPSRRLGEEATRQRFQSRMKWENEQRRISERSRRAAP